MAIAIYDRDGFEKVSISEYIDKDQLDPCFAAF